MWTNLFSGSHREQERALSQLRLRASIAQIVLALLLAVTTAVPNLSGLPGSARARIDVADPVPVHAACILSPTCLYAGDVGEDPDDDPPLHVASFKKQDRNSAAVVFRSLIVEVRPSRPSRAHQATGPPIL
jgi:hypothetical protein